MFNLNIYSPPVIHSQRKIAGAPLCVVKITLFKINFFIVKMHNIKRIIMIFVKY